MDLATRQIHRGADVDHEWTWWRKMLPYFLDRLGV
jgi:esterase/lipase superfamily enzyme